jgi:hypothetical protein
MSLIPINADRLLAHQSTIFLPSATFLIPLIGGAALQQ